LVLTIDILILDASTVMQYANRPVAVFFQRSSIDFSSYFPDWHKRMGDIIVNRTISVDYCLYQPLSQSRLPINININFRL